MKIFVISLTNAIERRNRVQKVMDELHINFEFFDAINGFVGLPDRLTIYPDDLHRTICRSRPLTPGEKGCYASHYLLWEKCIELNEPILILEDDFLPTPYFLDVLATLNDIHHKYEYIKIEPQIGVSTQLETINNMQIVLWHDNSRWTTGYSISTKGAQRLLRNSNRWLCSVDNYIGESYRTGLLCAGIIPYAIYSPHDMGSDIQNKVPLNKVPLHFKLIRELYRFYRTMRMYIWNRKNY